MRNVLLLAAALLGTAAPSGAQGIAEASVVSTIEVDHSTITISVQRDGSVGIEALQGGRRIIALAAAVDVDEWAGRSRALLTDSIPDVLSPVVARERGVVEYRSPLLIARGDVGVIVDRVEQNGETHFHFFASDREGRHRVYVRLQREQVAVMLDGIRAAAKLAQRAIGAPVATW